MAGFEKGDLVKLKSGGPLMTVENPTAGAQRDRVFAVWFASNNDADIKSGSFSPETLKKVSGQ